MCERLIFFLSLCSSFSFDVCYCTRPEMCRFVAAASPSQAWWKFVWDENRSRSGNSGLQMIVATVIDEMCYTFWHRSAFLWQRNGRRKSKVFAMPAHHFRFDVVQRWRRVSVGVFLTLFRHIACCKSSPTPTRPDVTTRHALCSMFECSTSSVSQNCRSRRVFGSSVKRELLRLHVP